MIPFVVAFAIGFVLLLVDLFVQAEPWRVPRWLRALFTRAAVAEHAHGSGRGAEGVGTYREASSGPVPLEELPAELRLDERRLARFHDGGRAVALWLALEPVAPEARPGKGSWAVRHVELRPQPGGLRLRLHKPRMAFVLLGALGLVGPFVVPLFSAAEWGSLAACAVFALGAATLAWLRAHSTRADRGELERLARALEAHLAAGNVEVLMPFPISRKFMRCRSF